MHKALAEYCKSPSKFFQSAEEADAAADWNQEHHWFPAETKWGFTVWLDVGFGLLALTKGEKLIGTGKYSVVGVKGYEHIAVLDRDYYGTEEYLFSSRT